MIKLFRGAVVVVAILFLTTSTRAQTLSEQIAQELPGKLARDARQNGNIVRGAILFHQGNINCISCHRPSAEANRIGPDLSRMEADATDAYIVESILQPSKEIKKGFETTSVLTVDGEVFTGMIASEDENKVVLRSGAPPEKLTTIPRDDIQQIKPSSKSSMPDGLVNELSSRQQFLDLLRYVFDLRERKSSSNTFHALVNESNSRQLSDQLQGLVLINDMNCVACHSSTKISETLPTKNAPDLKWSAARLNPEYLVDFIADPQQAKPGTSMPRMLAHIDASEQRESADAIVHFLVSSGDNRYGQQSVEGFESASSQQGFDLFHSIGCVACHAPRNLSAEESPLTGSVPLGDLSNKYDRSALVEFLENPHAARPHGRMPNMQLTHREAIDLTAFLLQGAPLQRLDQPWVVGTTLAVQGKRLFEELNCASCHMPMQESVVSKAQDSTASRYSPVQSLDLSKGCLSDSQGNWPSFNLTESEKGLIRSTLSNLPSELSANQRIDLTLDAFNCTACHNRDGLGGVSLERSPHFQTTNLNLGEQGRIPPTLSGVGAKLRPDWMRDVLVNGRVIRPYMKTRMPQYGEENVGHLIELFQATDTLPDVAYASFDDQKEMRTLGLEIAGSQGLNCVACHTFQYKPSDTMPAVDLTEMAQRLKKDWFYHYMLDPQKFSPNTVMPSFWPGGKAMRPDIAGEPAYQVEGLWQYLLDGRQARAPRGVVREPLEIVVTGEARMLRRKFPSMTGKRGIGVGYPGGVNLAFDAEQMRLSQLWRGGFVDPSGVWYGQGHGTVRTLGQTLDFPAGPDLDDISNSWIADDGRPPNHKFMGYELDELRRPIFGYQFESVTVRDYFQEYTDTSSGQLQVRRSVKLLSPNRRDNMRFRVATADQITLEANGLYAAGRQLKIRIEAPAKSQIVVTEAGAELVVPISLSAQQAIELTIDYLW